MPRDDLQLLSKDFNLSGYSAAGSVMERMRMRLAKDNSFRSQSHGNQAESCYIKVRRRIDLMI